MFRTQFVLDASGNPVREVLEIFVFHFIRVCHQRGDERSHFGDFFMAATATFAMCTFFGTFTGAGAEFHRSFQMDSG